MLDRCPLNKLKSKQLVKQQRTQNFLFSPAGLNRSSSKLDLSLMFKQSQEINFNDQCQETACFDNFGQLDAQRQL